MAAGDGVISRALLIVSVYLACFTSHQLYACAFVVSERSRPNSILAQRKLPCQALTSTTISLPLSSSADLDVQVFDCVFLKDTCEELHDLAVEHAERGTDGSCVFYRSQQNPLTPLEQALNSILTALGDDNTVCEYWSRNEYLHMDVHADVDEQELEDDGTIRCPEYGHVLYLDIDPSIRGPTCIFSQYGGWQQPKEDDATIMVITVPAVQGRVLRFQGSAMHAAPKPTHRWFFSKQEEKELADADEDDDEMWDDNEEQQVERSVILFNTWNKEGPRGVTEDYAKGAMPEGIELDTDDDDTYLEQQQMQRVEEWQEDYGKDCRDLWCQPRSDWKTVPIHENDSPADTHLTVSLMGKRIRRQFPRKHVQLSGPADLRAALEEDSQPSQFLLVQTERPS